MVIFQKGSKHCSIFGLYLNNWWHGYFAKISEALFHIWIVSQYLMALLFCKMFRSTAPYLDCISIFAGMVTLQRFPKHCSIFGLYLNIWWHGSFAKSSDALLHIWIVYQYLMAWLLCKKFRSTAVWMVSQYLMAWLFCQKFRSTVLYLDCISIFDGMVTLQKVPKH